MGPIVEDDRRVEGAWHSWGPHWRAHWWLVIARSHGLSFATLCDMIAPAISLGHAFGRLAIS